MEKTTLLKLVVSAPDAPLTPDTGFTTSLGADATSGSYGTLSIVLGVVGILLALAAAIMLLYRRHCIKNGYGLSSTKTSIMMRSFCLIAAFAVTGSIASQVIGELGKANAATGFEPTTEGEITAEIQLGEEPQSVCATDVIRPAQALPAGYTVGLKASDLTLTTNANVKIASLRTAGTLATNTWGYAASASTDEADLNPIPATIIEALAISTPTEVESAAAFNYCVKLGPDATPGTYESTITYNIAPTYVTYALDFDANGGTLADTIVALSSDETIATSYEFTLPEAEPTAPAGSALNFYGWSLTGDSTSDVYEAGSTIEVTDLNTTLKAVWGYGVHLLTYDKNTTEEVTNFLATQKCIITVEGSDSCDVAVTKRTPVLIGSTLLGWSDDAYTQEDDSTIEQARAAVKYLPGEVMTLTADKTIHAVWWRVTSADYQMELRWGETPRDLDSHLTVIRNSDNHTMFTVYYSSKNHVLENGTINLAAALDIDDTTSFGPETITLNLLPKTAYSDYTFYYYINNYSGESSGKIKESGANITMMKYDGTVKEYEVASASGASAKYWNVFAIKNGEIVERNTLTSEPDLSY